MPLRPCLVCSTPAAGPRCDTHRLRREHTLSPAERGYDADWRRIRLQILERDGHICHYCGKPATSVDHIMPLAKGGARLDPANLVAACIPCNSGKQDR